MKKPWFYTEEDILRRLPLAELQLAKKKKEYDRVVYEFRAVRDQVKWYKRTLRKWADYNARTKRDS